MVEAKAPEVPSSVPSAAPPTGKGMWVGIVVVSIVIVVLLAAVFGGLFGAPPVPTPDHVEVTADAEASQPAGRGFNVTVRILDGSGGVVRDYAGNVTFSSTDGNATLPTAYTFVAGDGGIRTFPVTLRTAGAQTIEANATGVATPTKTVTVQVVPNEDASLWVIAIVSGDAQSGANGTALQPFVARVTDGFGNALASQGVNYTLREPAGMTGAWLSNNTTLTDAGGRAATTLTLGTGDGAGTYEVDAWLEANPSSSVRFTATKTA